MKNTKNHIINNAKTIVFKIGTSLLTDTDSDSPKITIAHIKPIISDIMRYLPDRNICIVSSGAIGFGMSILKFKTKPKELPLKQAAAAIGQNKLMQMYENLFSKYNKTVAQILLTQLGIQDRQRYLNARNTITTLFNLKAIPIINENDTVAVDEIKFGDNDKLAALVSAMINADLLVILTNIDGLLKNINQPDSLIEDVFTLTPELFKICGAASKSTTTGGMKSKLIAADITMSSGVNTIICNGSNPNIISEIFHTNNFKGTFFYPDKKPLNSWKRWIKYNLKPKGKIIIDAGAVNALKNHKSLLASGIKDCVGDFQPNDCVQIIDEANNKIAVGLTEYSSDMLSKIKGLKTEEIKKKLKIDYCKEVVHIDNLTLKNY